MTAHTFTPVPCSSLFAFRQHAELAVNLCRVRLALPRRVHGRHRRALRRARHGDGRYALDRAALLREVARVVVQHRQVLWPGEPWS